jgi:hypothetical protein
MIQHTPLQQRRHAPNPACRDPGAPPPHRITDYLQDGNDANGQVSGQVTNVVSGEVAELFGQQFPYNNPPVSLGTVALGPSGPAQYQFPVTPTLATRYTVKVFRNSSATTPLTSSATDTIYVIMNQSATKTTDCIGSECRVTKTITVQVPPSALGTQMPGPVYTYFAINYSADGAAATPETLQLGGGDPSVSTPITLSIDEYQFSMTFSYSTNNEYWHAAWEECTQSLEAQDGIGLPGSGSYGCGSPTIPESATYLG